jgi:hypothetical protein
LSEELSTSSTRLDNKTLDALKTLKTKWKASNISEVIDKLMKDHKNFEDRIKTLEDRLQASSQPQPAVLVEAPTTTKNETVKPAEVPVAQVESQPCPYYSFNRPQSLVHCSKDYDTKGMIHRVTQEVCDMCWDRVQSKKQQINDDATLADQNPCLCRFDHDEEWLCALNAPTVRRLEYGLKTCQACPDRLTEQSVKERGEALKTERYITCGAKITEDKKAGLLVWDSKSKECPHQGSAVPIQACFNIHCGYAKAVQYVPK